MSGSYRNPRYMFAHLFRDRQGAPIVGPEDPAFPKDRLIDGINGSLWRSGDATQDADLEFEMQTVQERAQRALTQRIIIPSSEFQHQNVQRVQIQTTELPPAYQKERLIDETFADMYAPPDLFDFELSLTAFQFNFYLVRFFEQIVAAQEQEAGEVFASNIISTESGIVQTWEDFDEPNVSVTTTGSGNVYSLSRGAPRRIWNMEYRNIGNGDWLHLSGLRRLAGIQNNAFWFDPPNSGDVEVETFQFIATPPEGTWNTLSADTNAAFDSDDAGSNPVNDGDYMRLSNTGAGANTLVQVMNLNEPTDLRGKMIRVDVNVGPGGTWAAVDDLAIRLRVATEADLVGGGADFSLSKVFLEQAPDSIWRRVWIDPNNIGSVGVGEQHGDFSSIQSIAFIGETLAQFETFDVANFRLVDKSKRPQWVELLNYHTEQVSANPSSAIKYDINLSVREVLT